MLQTKVLRIALLAGAALALGAGGAVADPPPMTPQTSYAAAPKIFGATAADDWTAWSERSGSAWQLKVRSPAGVVSAPAVPARKIPFDASLGVRTGGAVVLAYSRCTRDPRYDGKVAFAWYTARGCVVHLVDPVTGADQALRRTGGSVADVLPSVSGGTLAYATIGRHGRGSVVTRALSGGRPHRLYSSHADRVRDSDAPFTRGPAFVAVHAGHVAFLWDVVQGLHNHGFGLTEPGINLYVVDRGRVIRADAEGTATDGACAGFTDFTALTVSSKYAIAELTSAVGWELERVALTQPKRVRDGHRPATIEYAPGVDYGEEGYLPWTAVDDARLVLTAPAEAGDQIGEAPLPPFGAKDQLDNPWQCG